MTKIAILDTGIDIYHKRLRKYINFDSSKSFIDQDIKDFLGHGTAIAGIIIYDGLFDDEKKDLQIIVCKITNEMNFNINVFLKAFKYAIELKVNIINLSLSIYNSLTTKKQKEKIKTLIKIAYIKNIIVVASSGNRAQEDNIFNQQTGYIYVVTSKDFSGNIASYSKNISNAYSVFGGDINSIVDDSKIEDYLVVSTFPEYLESDYFNLFGVPKGYSFFWGTSIATARFTYKIVKVYEKYNEFNKKIEKELDKYKLNI